MNSDKLILGTVQFGLNYGINNTTGKPNEEQVFEVLDYAAQNGIKILDTADAYGNAASLIGNYISSRKSGFLTNTKFTRSQLTLHQQVSASLEALSSDRINVYFYHHIDDFNHNPNLLPQLQILKEKGLIKKIGISVYSNAEFKQIIDSDGLDVIQLPFNLLDNNSQRGELLAQAKEKNKEIQVRSVFLQGLFFMPIDSLPEKLKPLKIYLEKIHSIAIENNMSLEQLALSYVLNNPLIDYVIIGVDTLDQLKKNLTISAIHISQKLVNAVNNIHVIETELLYPKNWT
jgi:uncharacterized protein